MKEIKNFRIDKLSNVNIEENKTAADFERLRNMEKCKQNAKIN